MKKIFLLYCICVHLQSFILAQNCSGNFGFGSQFQIDNFSIFFPDCTEIEGNVTISGADITNLNGLSQITLIGGTLQVLNCPVLFDLTGLDNLEAVGGNLTIRINENLIDLNGLGSLTSVGLNCTIRDNPSLLSLDGLDELTSIGGNLWIFTNINLSNIESLSQLNFVGNHISFQQNYSMINLDGLQGIDIVHGDLDIQGNTGLTSLLGLENIQSIGGYLYFNNNILLEGFDELSNLSTIGGSLGIDFQDNISTLDGFENLTSVGGLLSIRHAANLESIQSLESLESINGTLTIWNCAILSSLEGIDNINSTTIDTIFIGQCLNLSFCHVMSICTFLGLTPGKAIVELNNSGCNTTNEILEACMPVMLMISNNGPVCMGQDAQFFVEGGTAYQWSGPNGFTSTDQNPILTMTTLEMAGTYEVSITTGTGNTEVLFTNLVINPLPSVVIEGDTAICPEGSLTTLSVPPGHQYLWNTGEVSNQIIVTTAGNYAVTVTDLNGCTASAEILITNYQPLVAVILGDSTFCAGDTIALVGSGGLQYLWNTLETTDTIIITSEGIYTVTVTDANGCTGEQNITVTTHSLPDVMLDPEIDTVCILDGAFELNGGLPTGGNYSGPGVISNSLLPSISGTGTHQIVYTVTNSDGCSNSAFALITILDSLECMSTSIRNLEALEIKLYPNPADDFFVINANEIPEIERLTILNIADEVVLDIAVESNTAIIVETGNFPDGLYVVSLQGRTFSIFGKVLVLRN